MNFDIPKSGQKLGRERVEFLNIFSTSCRRTILEMLKTSQSGHPGGSLSCLDYLSVLYAFVLRETNEKIVVSNGHISPGVYSILAEMGVVDHEELITTFRQLGSKFEGHVTRHIPGIFYGTGPLGVGVSVAAGFAKAEKLAKSDKLVWGLMGDGEAQEGQVHEMALFASKEKLNNLVIFCDYNQVQLTAKLNDVMPINLKALFEGYGWNVLDIDGHDYEALWQAINNAQKNAKNSDKPTFILGNTIMGKGIPMMEEAGKNYIPTWHGKAPKPDEIDKQLLLDELTISDENFKILEKFRVESNFNPKTNSFTETEEKLEHLKAGKPIVYQKDELTDCRSAYGKAVLSLAKENPEILAGSADVGGSVMTKLVAKELPNQHIEYGICEQNMVSVAGGLSFGGYVPFVSTFGAFLSSRSKDQARVNDINQANVKMVATHSGLSVGEDGPTHQAIDDMGSFLGMFNMMVLEPADPNHCDRIIRYIGTHHGNTFVRMGRHKLPVLTDENNEILFDEYYEYYYGRTDILRKGSKVTIVASGPMVIEALNAVKEEEIDAEIIIVSSPKQFDGNLYCSLFKTRKVIVMEDHNGKSGFASQVALYAAEMGIMLEDFQSLCVTEYQLSGKPAELYKKAGIGETALRDLLVDYK